MGQTWEARVGVQVKSALPPSYEKLFYVLQLGGTPIDGLRLATPLSQTPANATTAANPSVQSTLDPINAATGEYYAGPTTDLALGGPLPLAFSRYYAARLADEGMVQSALGANWMHNFDLRLPLRTDDQVKVAYQGGKIIYFVKTMGCCGWSLNFEQEPVRYQFTRGSASGAGDYWLLDPVSQRVYRFDDATGLLQAIHDRNGNRLDVTRDAGGKITQVCDWLAGPGARRALTFTYTGAQLTRVSDGARQVNFAYDANGHLASATDPLGNVTAYSYAADRSHGPLLAGQTLPAGNTPYAQAFNAGRQVASQTTAAGATTTAAYDTPAAGQTRVTRPDASVLGFTNQDLRLTTAVDDPAGKRYTVAFNDREQPAALHDRLGDATAMTYHAASGKLASYTDAEGRTTSYTYAAHQQSFANPADAADFAIFTFYDLAQVTYADGSQETFAYDTAGNVTAYTDRAGKTWRYTYNSWGQILTITNPLGGAATFTYNADGNLVSATDADTGVTSYGYDALRRLNAITRPGGAVARLTYDAADHVRTVTDELGAVTSLAYDANGNLATAANPLSNTYTLGHDGMDRPARLTDPLGHATTYGYDALGRLATVTDPNGHVTTYGYDPRGWLNRITDAAGGAWRIGYDDEGVPTSFTTPLGHTTSLQTDKLGRVTRVTDPLGAVTSVSRDALGRPTSYTDPLGQTTAYTYDAVGRLASVTPPLVGAETYTRNALGQITRITDRRGNPWEYGYSTMGRLTSFTDPAGRTWRYGYDAQGRLTTITLPGGAAAAGGDDGTALTITYDAAGRIIRVAYPGGTVWEYTYDNAGRLVTYGELDLKYNVRDQITSMTSPKGSIQVEYDTHGNMIYMGAGGAAVEYEYDANNRLVEVREVISGARVRIKYDADGRVIGYERANGANTAITRDPLGRPIDINDAGAGARQQYQYDAAGRTVSQMSELPWNPSPSAQYNLGPLTYDAAQQITNPGYSYSPSGNLTGVPNGAIFKFDASLMTSAEWQNFREEFMYDGLGRLIARRIGEGWRTWIRNDAQSGSPPVVEVGPDGQKTYHIYDLDGRLLFSILPNGEVHYAHYNAGDQRVFSTNKAGKSVKAVAYPPGAPPQLADPLDTAFTYLGPGAWYDPLAQLLWNDYSHYWTDANTQRTLTPDLDSNPYIPSRLGVGGNGAGASPNPVSVGQQFQLQGYVQDVRFAPGTLADKAGFGEGAFNGYFDITCDSPQGASASRRDAVDKNMQAPAPPQASMDVCCADPAVSCIDPAAPCAAPPEAVAPWSPYQRDAAYHEVTKEYVQLSKGYRLATFVLGKSNVIAAGALAWIEVGLHLDTLINEGTGAAADQAGIIYTVVSWLYDNLSAPSAPTPATTLPNTNSYDMHRGVQPLYK